MKSHISSIYLADKRFTMNAYNTKNVIKKEKWSKVQNIDAVVKTSNLTDRDPNYFLSKITCGKESFLDEDF